MKIRLQQLINIKNRWIHSILRLLIITAAALLMALNIHIFVRNAGLFPGGATGLTLLIQEICTRIFNLQLPYSLLNLTINAIPIYIGFRFIGKRFTFYSCIMIFLTGFFTDLLPSGMVTNDMLLSSIFGGIINGFVISLVLNVDATTGGTDFISIYLSIKSGMDSFNIILAINATILCTAGILFGWEKALYSIIFQYVSTQILHLLYRKYQKRTLLIVTDHPDPICKAIHDETNHGATILDAKGSFRHEQHRFVYTVVSRAEYHAVIHLTKSIDPGCFINVLTTEELSGHFNMRPFT